MKTYTVREYRNGVVAYSWHPYKQEKRALESAQILARNRMAEEVDILVCHYGEYEKAGEYSESIIKIK